METRYIYSAYGKEFKENMQFLEDQGVNKKIDELADLAYDLIKNENVDRTQLETYICSRFKFEVLHRVMGNPISIEKANDAEEKKNGK